MSFLIQVNKEYCVLAGNREWMNRNGIILTNQMEMTLTNEENLGRTAILCTVDGKIISLLYFFSVTHI